ncbi:uncharacterized protein LOC119835140 [Zerene cesonia]|uniref:uncharacterized protein LOC119835140 n=1 Tax=Zerene cesonia TaxID=33412 RepID=UPI0018E5067F|nr:uncharacterized protein LOC119835140 [Zerene cesonia]
MGDKDDYLTSYRVFFENFAATVNPEDQLPVYCPDYLITEAELAGDVIYWTIEYLREKSCPPTLLTPLLRLILDEVRTASKKFPNDFGFDPDCSAYRAIWLMQAVIARVNDVCLRYLDNSRLDTLPPPPPPDQREFRTVSAAMRNTRRVMEDRHVEIGNLEALFDVETTERTSFYAVYDGHAGASAAHYSAAHLHQYMVESPHYKKNLKRAMHDAFIRTDAEFIGKSKMDHRSVGGSTAVVVCVRGSALVVGWAGDSLALLAQRMRVMQLVHPHKPSREDERRRIESSGGMVMHIGTWRVNGQLAVSRAIGDAQYKPYVIAKPELGTVDLDGDEDFLVVACDGLWDVVSEDEVALSVYRQIATDPNDLKAVTKRLIVQAKRAGSEDNISIIVVFLKDPREIAAQNRPPMDLGLDNAVVNAPPFAVEGACNAAEAASADNGVSDSDSEDLGPETAVDVDADADDADVEMRSHEPPPPAPRATHAPPARIVEEGHVDGNLVDNVAESGEESEDEWNYYKGEGEREQNPSEEADEPLRSETPCQDNSAWESSSVDMNSSPLNPDAPPFVPGSVAGSDVLLAESPRKPLPMDDIEVPDVNQFQTGAGSCPGELQDLDNCDQLNGHHNISMEGVTEHLNGNDKCQLDSLGFGFNVGIESDKMRESSIIQDFERIQKDTTDFCNIQVFQSHTETNPFGNETNDELFERLKNKERDPMSMSFYQEKDDDTCERFSKLESQVDLNAVQPLPESDDEDIQPNGFCQNIHEGDDDKENLSPDQHAESFAQINNDQEPNNDIMRFDDGVQVIENNFVDNMIDCNVESNNMQNYSNNEFECNIQQENVMQTDTPESHKLLFEQIPEIPDGKSSELGFTNEDLLDPSESEKDIRAITPQDEVSQDVEIDDKLEESPCDEIELDIPLDNKDDVESTFIEHTDVADKENEIVAELAIENQLSENQSVTPELQESKENDNSVEIEQNIVVDVHQSSESQLNHFENEMEEISNINEVDHISKDEEAVYSAPKITLESDDVAIHDISLSKSLEPDQQQIASQSPLPNDFEQNAESPLPQESLQGAASLPRDSPLPDDLYLAKSPLPTGIASDLLESAQSPLPSQSPLPTEPTIEAHSPVVSEEQTCLASLPLAAEIPLPRESPAPSESPAPVAQSPLPVEEPVLRESPLPVHEPVLRESPLPVEEPVVRASPLPVQESVPTEFVMSGEESITVGESPLPVEESLRQSPSPAVSPFPIESQVETSIPADKQSEELPAESPVPDIQSESQEKENLLTDNRISSPVEEQHTDVAEELIRKEAPTPVESAASLALEECQSKEVQDSESPLPLDTIKSDISPAPSPAPEKDKETIAAMSPLPTEDIVALTQSDSRTTPEIAQMEAKEASREENAPAPDIVPEQTRSDLVTDIDIGIPESRAQEICVPVTSEIQQEDEVRPAGTPPPTPAVQGEQDAAPLSDTPIAAPAAALAGATVAAAAVAAAAAKPKAPAKKSPTTPTPRAPKTISKTTAPARTSLTATTPRSPATASPRLAAAKTPSSASKAAAPAARAKPASKPASPTKAAPRAAAPAKDAAAKPAAPRPATARPAPKPAAPKPPTTTAAPKPITRPAAPKVPSATAPAAPKPAAARPISAKTSSTLSAAPKPKEVKKVPEKKPLTNGDVKAAKPAPRPAPAAPRAAPPARAPAPAARPAPRPTARAPPAPPTKTASAKPPVKAPLDKQSKDLANKRITAKTAPPRTANTKSSAGGKTAVRSAGKRGGEAAGAAGAGGALKAPPSPPADGALLPDVIA